MLIPYIEQKTEKILHDFDLFTTPVDVVACAKRFNVDVEEITFEDDDVSGLFVLKEKLAFIRYSTHESEVRQRFTIAHELGHFVLHSKDFSLFVDKKEKVLYRNSDSSSGEKHKEREANAFAASLLMPRKLVGEQARQISNDIPDIIPVLAKIFNVSEIAMSIRLSNLGMLEYGNF